MYFPSFAAYFIKGLEGQMAHGWHLINKTMAFILPFAQPDFSRPQSNILLLNKNINTCTQFLEKMLMLSGKRTLPINSCVIMNDLLTISVCLSVSIMQRL